MATVKKCDRCGKNYDPYNYRTKDFKGNDATLKVSYSHNNGKRTPNGNITYFIDLCPECMNALDSWIKEPTAKKN